MTERQMFRAIVRGFGVFLAVSAVETYWFDLDRLLGLVSNTGYRYSISHEFLDASIQIGFAYLLIRKSDWLVRLVYGQESAADRISN